MATTQTQPTRCYCASTRQVARRLTRFYEAALRGAGMNPAQYELMSNLKGRSGASQSELAAAMDVDQTTLSRNLKLLIAQGWVTGTASAKDARRSEYRLTPAGRESLRKAKPGWERATRAVSEKLGGDAGKIWKLLDSLGAAAQ
jgi:DNA-binding MarR family transcriptional regulator